MDPIVGYLPSGAFISLVSRYLVYVLDTLSLFSEVPHIIGLDTSKQHQVSVALNKR